VALEQPDSTGIDRIVMQAAADAQGNFRFLPATRGTFDVVVVVLGTANLPYNATAVVNVPNGTNLSVIHLLPKRERPVRRSCRGLFPAKTASGGAVADVGLAALADLNVSASVTVN